MSYLAPDVDLRELWEARSELSEFKTRDVAYKVTNNTYLSRSSDGNQAVMTWRPIMLDNQLTADNEHREAINLARQIGLHHQASFANPPRLWNRPPDDPELGHKNTQVINSVLQGSKIKILQGRQSHFLTVRGDAVYGIGYNTDPKADLPVWVRGMDPKYCYPAVDDREGLGSLQDNLITYSVRRKWAEKHYNVSLPGEKTEVRVFEYWDDEWRLMQIDKVKLQEPWKLRHNLGFVPWYWCYNQIPGLFAQSDISETTKVQELVNDILLLTLDATRRNVDKSYIGIGVKGNLEPRPGKILGIANPQARVEALETAVPPQMLISVMNVLQSHGMSMAGISPISMEGMAEGSIVTGSAVRHQVEAIEARMNAKRSYLEAVFSWIGSSSLRVLAKKFASRELSLHIDGRTSHKGSDVGTWFDCQASYGSFDGLTPTERGNWAMQGLGRVHGRRTAIQLAYPESDVQAVEREIDDFQLQQATVAAQAQAAAQQILSGGDQTSPSAPPQGAPAQAGQSQPTPPQLEQRPPIPGMQQLGSPATVSDLKLLLRLVQGRLKGEVYAIGEMAITGMALAPDVAVTEEEDRPVVMAALAPKNVRVQVGVHQDEPSLLLSDS